MFDEAKKRDLPFLPRVIGVITSPTGAVIRDMLAGFAERFPAHVVLWPVRVQGETCAAEVAAAIKGFNAIRPGGPVPRPDVLIVARGGGSLEDLWGFNDEMLVRAAAASAIPLISAVGHETDWTLLDLVADARAPTPTKAAEWAVPKYGELVEQTGELGLRLARAARRTVDGMRRAPDRLRRAACRAVKRWSLRCASASMTSSAALDARCWPMRGRTRSGSCASPSRLAPSLLHDQARPHARPPGGPGPARGGIAAARDGTTAHAARAGRSWARARSRCAVRIARGVERSDLLGARLRQCMVEAAARRRRHLDGAGKLLASLGYHGVLQRGFALVRDSAGRSVRSTAQVADGQRLDIELADGHIGAQACELRRGSDGQTAFRPIGGACTKQNGATGRQPGVAVLREPGRVVLRCIRALPRPGELRYGLAPRRRRYITGVEVD